MESQIGKIFVLSLFLVFIVNLIVPDKEQSEEENRMLETVPSLSLTGIMNGDFMEQWESYMSDQFVGRNLWRRIKVCLDRLGGIRVENGVYIGKDGQLLADIALPDDGQFSDNINAIKSFADTYSDTPTTVMLIPDAASILSDSLPIFATADDGLTLMHVHPRFLGELTLLVMTLADKRLNTTLYRAVKRLQLCRLVERYQGN